MIIHGYIIYIFINIEILSFNVFSEFHFLIVWCVFSLNNSPRALCQLREDWQSSFCRVRTAFEFWYIFESQEENKPSCQEIHRAACHSGEG